MYQITCKISHKSVSDEKETKELPLQSSVIINLDDIGG